jgi:hypothetical protein
MKRRSFFSKCAIFVAGCAVGVKANLDVPAFKWVENPAWETATYEMKYMSYNVYALNPNPFTPIFFLREKLKS